MEKNSYYKTSFARAVAKAGLATVAIALSLASATAKQTSRPQDVNTIRIDAVQANKKFDPDRALGTSIDIFRPHEIDKVYSEAILKELLSAGWGPITSFVPLGHVPADDHVPFTGSWFSSNNARAHGINT